MNKQNSNLFNQKLIDLQKKIKKNGIKTMTEEELICSIQKQDQNHFAEIKIKKHNQQKQNIDAMLNSSDINPEWNMRTVERIIKREKNSNNDFNNAYEILKLLCSHIKHHEGAGGVCWLLLGSFGRGKSTLAGAIYHRYVSLGYNAIMIQWQKLIETLWNKTESSTELIRQIYTVDLLVIDEIGYNATNLRNSEQAQLSTILRNRKSNCRSIILCSNHFPETFEKAIGSAASQGLRDYNIYTSVFEGKSHRRDLFQDINGKSITSNLRNL